MFTFHFNLKILMLCEDFLLKQTITNAKFSDNIKCDIFYNEEELPDKADIIFFDVNSPNPSELREKYSKARLILCSDGAYAESLDEKEISCVNRLWETPLGARMTVLRFNRLINEIYLEKENNLNLNCLNAAIDTMPDMLWFKSVDGIHTKVNKAFCEVVGKTREDVTGKDHCYIWNISREEFDNGGNACQESEEKVIRERHTCQFLETVKSQKGMRKFKTYKTPVFGEDGEVLGTVGIGQDITDLKNYDTKLEIVLNSMPYAVALRDMTGVVTAVNPKFEEFFKTDEREMVGRYYSDWFDKTFDESSRVATKNYLEAKSGISDLVFEIYDEPIRDVFRNIIGSLSIYRDVTRMRSLEKELLRSSQIDFLTGLDNRRSFYHYIRENHSHNLMGLLYIDLDHFKELNDTYGHHAGDDALVHVAELFRSHFTDNFIARFGGDEFVVAVENRELDELKSMAKSLQEKLKDDIANSEYMSGLTLSIGISITDDPYADIDQLISQADTALYEAKERGRNICCVYSEL